MDHQQHRGHGYAEGGAEAHTESAEALVGAEIHVVLSEIAQDRQHCRELQRVAKPEARLCSLLPEENRPTSAAEGERDSDHTTNARASEQPEGGHKVLVFRAVAHRVLDAVLCVPDLFLRWSVSALAITRLDAEQGRRLGRIALGHGVGPRKPRAPRAAHAVSNARSFVIFA